MLQTSDSNFGTADPEFLSVLFSRYTNGVTDSSVFVEPSPSEIAAYIDLETHLAQLSQRLARDAPSRQAFATSGSLLSVLECLSSFLAVFERSQRARQPAEEFDPQSNASSVEANGRQQDPYRRACQIATLCMRVLRNTAACSQAQELLCQHFHLVSPFLDNITRFHTLNDPDATLLSRAAAQMLSNIVTANRVVQREMWHRLVTTSSHEGGLALKLLSSPDTNTQSAAQILLINFLRTPAWTEDAHERCHDLCTSASGLRLIQSLLSSSESIMLRTALKSQDDTSHEYEPESEINGLEESLGFIYTIFAMLFERGYSSKLISALAPIEEISASSILTPADQPVISSSQLTLLKLLDSWLHLQQKQVAKGSSGSIDRTDSDSTFELAPNRIEIGIPQDKAMRGAGMTGLIEIFVHLSKFARSAMESGIAKDGQSEDQQPQDRRLFGVHHGLLLLLQCLLSISMTADGWSDELSSNDESFAQGTHSFAGLSRILLSDMRRDEALVDELVALLDQTHRYAPALSPFRPSEADASSRQGSSDEDKPLPEGHALSSTGKAAYEDQRKQNGYGFDHLKRDIVRVLGSLVYAPTPGSKDISVPLSGETSDLSASSNGVAQKSNLSFTKTQIHQVQDRIREQGGLFHVLNMTVLDERNPYMREHAIFALRYLLAGNMASQQLVNSLQPSQPNAGRGGMQMPMV